MRRFTIGFSRPTGFFNPFSWAIRAVERTSYSHVYIRTTAESISEDLIYQASGTRINFMGIEAFHSHAKTVVEYEFQISDDSYKAYLKWAVSNCGRPYGLKNIIGILLARIFKLKINPFGDGESRQYCAELAARALNDFIGAKISESEFELCGPRRIHEICQRLDER